MGCFSVHRRLIGDCGQEMGGFSGRERLIGSDGQEKCLFYGRICGVRKHQLSDNAKFPGFSEHVRNALHIHFGIDALTMRIDSMD